MRICFLAPANNYHTKKWCKWFTEQGHEVHVISFIDSAIPNVTVHYINTGADAEASDTSKLKYLTKTKEVKKTVDAINPDVINVHYATSYGTVAALSGLKKYVLSVWGSDVYDFPKKSPLHKALLKFSLARATYLFSTSQAMADETHKYTKKKIEITPFGVDMELFNPDKRTRETDNYFVVGTVKALTPKYGIDYLLKAVAIIKNEYPEIPIRLRVVGKGEQERQYKDFAKDLGIDQITTWLGFISQENAAKEWANMDLAVIPSTLESESFGVFAVEAEACGTPVIVSDIPGLMEATLPGVTSVVVPRKNEEALVDAIVELYKASDKRLSMGIEGRKFVCSTYELNKCFDKTRGDVKEIAEPNWGAMVSDHYNVDTTVFRPARRTRNIFVIGTVKGLESVYGIDIILKAAQIVRTERPDIPLRVRIAGKGSKAEEYKILAEELGIADIVTWLGFISQECAAKEWANMDVAIIPSRQESFGVSAVEAQACGTPVIISDIPGLKEATCPSITSLVIPKYTVNEFANGIIKLYENTTLMERMRSHGLKYVNEKFEYENCFRRIETNLERYM